MINFSLWGSHKFYNYGALENAFSAKIIICSGTDSRLNLREKMAVDGEEQKKNILSP